MRPTNIFKHAYHHWSSGKCKSEPHGDTISCHLEWRSFKNLKTTDTGGDMDKKGQFQTVGGGVD